MTREELAVTVARAHRDGGHTFEDLRREYADHYAGRMAEPSRGWIARLVQVGRDVLNNGGADAGMQPDQRPDETRMDSGVYTDGGAEASAPVRHRPLLQACIADIECTDFNTEGLAGFLICVCILPLNADRPTTLSIRYEDFGDDRWLLGRVAEALAEFDIVAGHNWSAFDYNWLNSKLMYHGMPPLRTHYIFDTYQIAKSLGLKTRKGLGNLTDYFHLEGEKTTIFRRSWNDIRHPSRAVFNRTLTDIVYHCEQDTIANRNLMQILFPYALSMRANPFKLSKLSNMEWGKQEAKAA